MEKYRNKNSGVDIREQMEELINKNRYVGPALNITNVTLSVVTCFIYLIRISNMCGFDKEPIWKFDSEEDC